MAGGTAASGSALPTQVGLEGWSLGSVGKGHPPYWDILQNPGQPIPGCVGVPSYRMFWNVPDSGPGALGVP